MIIQHSLKILEQLSQVEALIQKLETYIEKEKLNVDRDALLERILKAREARTSRER